MKKYIITLMAITLVNLSNLLAYQDINLAIIDDGPEIYSPSHVVSPITDIIIPVNDLNLEILSELSELRAAITAIRDLLSEVTDPVIRMELEYQLAFLEDELSTLTQANAVDVTTSFFDQIIQTFTNLIKTVHDTALNVIRNMR